MSFNSQHLQEEIVEQYLADDNNRPWIVGFSGGKDSTMLLQLVWYAIRQLPEELRTRKVYVVCNNTLVENPKIIEYTERVLHKIQEAAANQSMPMYVQRTTPKLEETFWVNLIGKGYPAPNNIFRWCTERLKINPTTQFILEVTHQVGEAIILLGTRSAESSRRARSIKKYEIKGERLRKHIIPNAYVYAVIKDVETAELWRYLNQVPSPWGSENKELVTLYQNANGGDCPLVIDKTTPSCGNSRFGCWVCTVVNRDKSMEALIENGEDWMEPLMELRDILARSRDDENLREKRRRDGTITEGILGPYIPSFRAEFLEGLLKAQKEIQEEQPEINLINYQELVAIQVLWYRDNIFNYKVADIYNKVYGTDIKLDAADERIIKEKELLKQACVMNPKDFELINELLALQKTRTILMNSRGLQTDLENRLKQFVEA
ncbi:DNA sulfur modification protein DndC [Parapedobacter luteus]|uniref:DNA sulfur modification protein DndC n=1 Tax=Parapedobacter luteus TaxID=623280 RepID=A0A1T5CT26_9SPHI|nr:DNA phosphorothioation system sulfurtransferase DndC [Parapedobacter luteus]SKB62632.1 DNA sulfur modification protein DndC [Parapedobacter luteus]